jgi:hypothetical protein
VDKEERLFVVDWNEFMIFVREYNILGDYLTNTLFKKNYYLEFIVWMKKMIFLLFPNRNKIIAPYLVIAQSKG